MQRFLIMMSPKGYEMSTALVDDPEVTTKAKRFTMEQYIEFAQVPFVFKNGRRAGDNNRDEREIKDLAKELRNGHVSKTAQQNGGVDLGAQMAYYMRKTHAPIDDAREFCFGLEADDLSWIYQRSPEQAGLMLCKLFDGTKPGAHVNKELEDPRTGKKRRVMGINLNTNKEWDNRLEYEMEDFHELYKVKERANNRRTKRN